MKLHKRQEEILDVLAKKKFQTVSSLAKQFFSSEATIRRDLTQLEKRGDVERVNGGAFYVKDAHLERPISVTNLDNGDKKAIVAALALDYISENQIIFLDSSSTCFYLAQKLSYFNNLTIVTNGLLTAHMLSEETNNRIFSTGGEVYSKRSSVNGYHALRYIEEHNADLLFLSCKGINTHGITDLTESEALVKKSFHKKTAKTILLVDSSKFSTAFFCEALTLNQIDVLITDAKLPLDLEKACLENDIEVILPAE
ncbi:MULTISPECIES: DeoR/GlpR family DNA-binding transcription regulator [Enterococcus]|uniref:DeoR/GlpR family DNA-binding transcription regulator n=1 Tax=Enterococcus alishanensis TaxID=1303817 RepID=A0ABS6TEI0_9ENTE|nr:DeoR/GlpR family DNA-binding transcription regulator [Enterococcus alishanensis]MBV7391315.1 DeoR/GlpR family DNA-binding transcription regulator [Enterococcus alishanensis]